MATPPSWAAAFLTTNRKWRVRELKNNSARDYNAGADHLPSMTLTPSHTAPTSPVTMIVITALNV
jgi:hypothetical protein